MSRNSKLIVFVAIVASLLEIIDMSIVNVAIPTMMGNLGATLQDISMVVTGYAIANAIVLPLAAWLGEKIGRRKYFLGCILLFTAASVSCGLAPNLEALIIFRIIQGLAGGALLPTSQALIYEQFPKEKAGIAGAIFGMSVMIGPTLGPTLGGYLTDEFGWRSIFNVNLPIGILALVVGYLCVQNVEDEETRHSRASKIDSFGLSLLVVGIGCLQYVLERGESDDWFASNIILVCSLLASIALPTFVWWELKIKNPIVNIRLFADTIVRNGVLLMTALGFFLYSLIFLLPVFVGRVMHYDATQTGLLFIPGSLLTAIMMPIVGKQLAKRDPRMLIAIGLISIEICLWMFSGLDSQVGERQILNALYLRGFGMAFLFVPINSSILSQFKGRNLGQVSGLLNLSRQLGGSIGIALVGTLLARFQDENLSHMSAHISAVNQVVQTQFYQIQSSFGAKMLSLTGGATGFEVAVRVIASRMHLQSFVLSFNQLMIVIASIFGLVFYPLLRLKFRKQVKNMEATH